MNVRFFSYNRWSKDKGHTALSNSGFKFKYTNAYGDTLQDPYRDLPDGAMSHGRLLLNGAEVQQYHGCSLASIPNFVPMKPCILVLATTRTELSVCLLCEEHRDAG